MGGSKKAQSFCPGDKIQVWTGVSAFHYGTHFVDMVPQSAAQIRGMRNCPNGYNFSWVSGDRMKNYPLPCYDPNANPVPTASGHLQGAIRLSVPLSLKGDTEGGSEYRDFRGNRLFGNFSGQFMVKTEFELPHEVKFEAGPIIFRWMWFCGVDVANGERQAWGMGELFHACMDARISNTCGAPPAPTTQAPTTEAPEITTSAPETTTQRPRPTLPDRPSTEAPVTTQAPTTEATTTEAPVTTEAPATEAPEEITCRRYSGSNAITPDDWCANNCLVNGILMYTMCCDEANESQCPKDMHCYCPPGATHPGRVGTLLV